MEILIGTTNPAKAKFFSILLEDFDVRIVTLSDLGIEDEPTESGATPAQNAAIKADFYAKYAENVLCQDSGLYFDALEMTDSRQPGLTIRRPNGGERLDDDQMIAYYSQLVRSLGGKAMAYYVDGFAFRLGDALHTFQMTREEAQAHAFYMLDTPCEARRPGWPLDSLSVDLAGISFLEPRGEEKSQLRGGYMARRRKFFEECLRKKGIK